MKILEERIIKFDKEIPRCSPTTFKLLDLNDPETEEMVKIEIYDCIQSYEDPKALVNRKAEVDIAVEYWMWESDFSQVILGFIIRDKMKLVYSVVNTFDFTKVTPALINLGIERICAFMEDLMKRLGKNIYGLHATWLSHPVYEAYWKRFYEIVESGKTGIKSLKYETLEDGDIATELGLS